MHPPTLQVSLTFIPSPPAQKLCFCGHVSNFGDEFYFFWELTQYNEDTIFYIIKGFDCTSLFTGWSKSGIVVEDVRLNFLNCLKGASRTVVDTILCDLWQGQILDRTLGAVTRDCLIDRNGTVLYVHQLISLSRSCHHLWLQALLIPWTNHGSMHVAKNIPDLLLLQ